MKPVSIDHPRVHRAFQEAFQGRERGATPLGEAFTRAVMREVRSIAAPPRSRFADMAWRLAPVACGIIFAGTLFFMGFDPMLEHDIAALSISDPMGLRVSTLCSF